MNILAKAATSASQFSADTFCTATASIWNLLGIAVTVIKIAIPIILIIFGMLDMGKAVTSGKDDEIKKQLMSFMRRAIAAVLVFFVPSIVGMLMSVVNDAVSVEDNCGWAKCIDGVTGMGSAKDNCQS